MSDERDDGLEAEAPGAAYDAAVKDDTAGRVDYEALKKLPFWRRFKLYLDQRFPLFGHGILILSYFSANQFLAQAVTTEGRPMVYAPYSWLNFLLLLCLFFHLRVFDEHKDKEKDLRAYPERLLSKGVVTYDEVWRVGMVVIAIEVLIVLLAGPATILTWSVAFLWSLLMYKEFFIGEWLNKHVFLYAITHTTIMFTFDLTIWSVTTGRWLWEAGYLFIIYAFVGVFVAFTFEFARKIRMPEDEHEFVDSYSKHVGPYWAAYMVLGTMTAATICTMIVGWKLELHWAFFATLASLLALSTSGFIHFRLAPSRVTAKRLEIYSSLYIVAFDWCLVAFLVVKKGLEFNLFGGYL